MNNLINTPPTSIVRRADSTIFYFGVKPDEIAKLSGNASFYVVHSPVDAWGWEFVRYQVFEDSNGMFVTERRSLEADEIAHFQRLLTNWKPNSDEK